MVAVHGTPLVETGSTDDWRRVTFLWRGDAQNVVLCSRLGDPHDPVPQLARIPGTDVWFRTYEVRADLRVRYKLAINDSLAPLYDYTLPLDQAEHYENSRAAGQIADPLARHAAGDGSQVTLDGAPVWQLESRSERQPQLVTFGLPLDGRPTWFLEPRRSGPRRLLVVLDGDWLARDIGLTAVLDDLHARELIEPTLAVFVDSRGDGRLADMTNGEHLTTVIVDWIVPWARAWMGLRAGADSVTIVGASLGGLAAIDVATRSRGRIGSALAVSSALWWPREDPGQLARDLPNRTPCRLVLAPGLLEVGFPGMEGILQANCHLAAEARKLGWAVDLRPFNGGHDSAIWRDVYAFLLQELLNPRELSRPSPAFTL